MIEHQKADEIYNLISNGNSMTTEELRGFIEEVFFDISTQQLSQILKPFGNVVTKSEFSGVLELLVRKKASNLDVFNAWDRKRKGFLDKRDIEMMLKSYGLDFKDSYIDDMLGIFEGKDITFEEFDRLISEMDETARKGPE